MPRILVAASDLSTQIGTERLNTSFGYPNYPDCRGALEWDSSEKDYRQSLEEL
jgi:hypothetical protein